MTEETAANATTNGTFDTTKRKFRYVLRNGVTVAMPIDDKDGSIYAPEGEFDVPERGPVTEGATLDPMWNRLPRHIQLLASITEPVEEEVAQKYYKRGFEETRPQLIERLLNPTLTLEETARVLGVCPATVRRYTNRGVLPHFRTVGQQRRFRLSDVLIFMEQQVTRRALYGTTEEAEVAAA